MGLSLRFQSVASKLRILNFNAKDLNEEYLFQVIKQYLPKELDKAIQKRCDLTDSATLWEILGIDGVILLENQEGNLIRVGVSLVDNENKARNLLYDTKRKEGVLIRQALNISQYWIFLVKWKDFPEKEEWIDILYDEIDNSANPSDCRLIIL